MLIIPLTGKISRQNLPWVTIGIVLINCFAFFYLQKDDGQRYRRAIRFYITSELARIEVSRYIVHLQKEGEEISPPLGELEDLEDLEDLDQDALYPYYEKMQRDRVFMKKLENDEIITPEDEEYPTWKSLRTKYEDILSTLVSFRYGFTPARKSYVTAFTYMFLHGSFMHLLGNMVFLWLVGCVLEVGCGRLLYLMMYLLTGIFSVVLFYLVYMDSTVPLIGASGAIAGLMGAFTVTHGKRKIKVFYSIGIYFNYAKVSGIFLLPVWIGNEIFQLFFGGYTQVAYVAHLGGLISGAALGFLNLKFIGRIDEEVFGEGPEDPKNKIALLLEQALKRIGELDMEGARPFLVQVLEIEPNNRNALTHLFNIDKLNPENERFHITASKLLGHLSHDKEALGIMHNTYREYTRIAKGPKFNLDLLSRLSLIFAASGYLEESERIMVMLLKKHPKFQKVPTGILKLGRVYLKKGMFEKGRKCFRIICQRYPESAEYQMAYNLLKGSK
jgi:membrane associated rhomboid family serine protease